MISSTVIYIFFSDIIFLLLYSKPILIQVVLPNKYESLHVWQYTIVRWVFLLRKWFYFPFVLPSCLIKHANKTTTAHAPHSANGQNNNSQHERFPTSKGTIMLARWWPTCQSNQLFKRKAEWPQKVENLENQN